jgi:hypothetical protein
MSVAIAVFALFVPSSLTIFLAKPQLFAAVGFNGVILLSVCISLPILMLLFAIWWTPLTTVRQLQRIQREGPPRTEDLESQLNAEDPLEWPCLFQAAWTAHLILFLVAAVAYYRPIRIGATFILLGLLLVIVWVLVMAVSVYAHLTLSAHLKRRVSP